MPATISDIAGRFDRLRTDIPLLQFWMIYLPLAAISFSYLACSCSLLSL
jgi:hypothetical protein